VDASGGPGAAPIERVREAQRGDTAAFAALVDAHEAALRRFCDRLTGGGAAAEDLAQETLLRAFQALPRLEDPARFGAWLFGIAMNLARVVWRRRRRAPLSLEELPGGALQRAGGGGALWTAPALAAPEDAYARAEQARRLMDAIEALPPQLRHTVLLHYVEDLSYAEVAAAMRVPVTTVKGWLHKSRTRLRRTLADEAVGTGRSASRPGPRTPDRKETQMAEGARATGAPTGPGGGPAGAWWEEVATVPPALFGDDALGALRGAEEEARRWQHGYVGTEHLLVAVLNDSARLPARVLSALGAPPGAVRAALENRVGRGDAPSPPRLSVAPRTRLALELAREDMRFLKHERIAPEHLLLGLVQVPQGVAALILESMGVSLAQVRASTLGAIPLDEESPRSYWQRVGASGGR
jgi:RNA polymerase sigma factor (sigma-70 family)